MISTPAELSLTHEQLGRIERALEAIRREVRPVNESLYRVMAEGYIDQIRELRAQIYAYLGLNECEGATDGDSHATWAST